LLKKTTVSNIRCSVLLVSTNVERKKKKKKEKKTMIQLIYVLSNIMNETKQTDGDWQQFFIWSDTSL